MASIAVLPDPGTADDGLVVSEAVRRLAGFWELGNATLGRIIGVSEATAYRLRAGSYTLRPQDKPFELALYLVRLFRGLDAVMGSDDRAARSWLRVENLDLGVPLERMKTIGGLIETADYVDGWRAQV